MIIAVASGKGGTGKTTISTSLFLAVGEGVMFVDCDVEEPNSNIFLKPKIIKKEMVTVLVPQIDLSKCNFCGKCEEVCQFNSLVVAKDNVLLFPELCHSCGACRLLCPRGAIKEVKRPIGQAEFGSNFLHGHLNIGEAMPVPMIGYLKKRIKPGRKTIIDCPPGTACAAVESMKGCRHVLLVTEPTPFGFYDFKLMVDLVRKLKIKFSAIINQCDIGDREVEDFCRSKNISVQLKIPFDRKIAEAYSKGKPLVAVRPELEREFKRVYDEVSK